MSGVLDFLPTELDLSQREAALIGASHQQFISKPANGNLGLVFSPTSTNELTFTWTSSDGVHMPNCFISVDVSPLASGGTADLSAVMNNVADMFIDPRLSIDGTQALELGNPQISLFRNIIMLNEGASSYFSSQAAVMMGYNNQEYGYVEALGGSKFATLQSRGRLGAPVGYSRYVVPCFWIHPVFACDNVVPGLGSNFEFTVRLADASRVISRSTGASPSYQITNVEMFICEVYYQAEYKRALETMVRGSEGYAVHFADLKTMLQSTTASSSLSLILRNDYSNLLSVYLADVSPTAWAPQTNHAHPAMRSKVGLLTTNMTARTGGRQLLIGGSKGSNGPLHNFLNLKQCSEKLANIDATGAFTPSIYFGDGTNKPALAPIGFSVEKTDLSDTTELAVINRGMSRFDNNVSRDIDIQLTLSEAWTATDQLYSCLVYQKTLEWKNGMLTRKD